MKTDYFAKISTITQPIFHYLTTNTKDLQRFKTQIATKQTQQSKPRCHGFGFGVVVPVVDGGGARGVWLWLN